MILYETKDVKLRLYKGKETIKKWESSGEKERERERVRENK